MKFKHGEKNMEEKINCLAEKQHFSFKIKILKVKRKIRNIIQEVLLIFRKVKKTFVLVSLIILGTGKASLAIPHMYGSSFLINHYKQKILYSLDFETEQLIRNGGWITPEPYSKNKADNRLIRKILHTRVPLVRIYWVESELNSHYLPKKATISLKRVGPGYKTDDAILFLPKKSLFRSWIDLSKKHLSYGLYFEHPVRETPYIPVRKLRKKMITSDGEELTMRRILKMFMNHFKYGMKKDPLTQLLMEELKRRMREHSITAEQAFECMQFFCNKTDPNSRLQKEMEAYLKKTNQQEKTRFLVDSEKPFKK